MTTLGETLRKPSIHPSNRLTRLRIELFGYKFSAPFFIAPAANAGHGHDRAELNFAEAAGDEEILYTVD
jgi:isopentenyl diphosphate isomerase/L-lactate dehydrogenase-like FMN-dependent dehydrogenase